MKFNSFIAVILILFCSIITELKAQYTIHFIFETPTDSILFFSQPDAKNFRKEIFTDSSSARNFFKNFIFATRQKNFLEISCDSIFNSSKNIFAKIHLGQKIKNIFLDVKNLKPKCASDEKIIFTSDSLIAVNVIEIDKLEKRIVKWYNNNGYPFASLELSLKNYSTDSLIFFGAVESNKYFILDSVYFRNLTAASLPLKKIVTLLKKGMTFNQDLINNVTERIKTSGYSKEIKPTLIDFFETGRANVQYFLESKRDLRFSGLIGVQPTTGLDGSTQFQITLDAQFDMFNYWNWGERVSARFDNLRAESPHLQLNLELPFIPNLPFGVNAAFNLYKRDSAYIETNTKLGVVSQLDFFSKAELQANIFSASNLIIDTSIVLRTRQLPANFDVTNTFINFIYEYKKLDYAPNPYRGFVFNFKIGLGQRLVSKNADILRLRGSVDSKFSFESLYDTVTLKTTILKPEFHSEYYLPLARRATVKWQIDGAALLGTNQWGTSELFRLGGNRLQRGFDEESLLATQFALSTLELRLLTGKNTYLMGFYDFGAYRNNSRISNDTYYATGVGLGAHIDSKAGIFSVTFGVGKFQNTDFDFGRIKTHFGYVSRF